jgi:hypothetical protein
LLLNFLGFNEEDGAKEPDSDEDVYIFDYEDKALENYKAIHPGETEDNGGLKYSDPDTGAHFEFEDICERLQGVQKLRKKLD